ncbi:helix-turn-helix domain-containing protein (plasmid) [Apilactobacillus apisilvae]|uniref:Helix-turn-helix domain-containing protein n=1 Tax=Apilactobacillus apisilvae TaxID=2923364 RepID=A0ABY4PJM1_9LACO|nr:helix-turn-helix domain-containing protein [Apilactobacillus apisilvae]UQS85808.1 helix-turn-helix domain-containing protein [Apilactobacillus apisilvae]
MTIYKFDFHKVVGARNELGLTQAEMANKIGINRNSYSLKERGKRSFGSTELANIANVTKKPVEYFFSKIVTDSKRIVA